MSKPNLNELLTSWVASIEARPRLKNIVFPIIALLPPTLLGSARYYKEVGDLIDYYPVVKFLMVIWPIFPIFAVYFFKKYQRKNPLTVVQLVRLTEILARIVGKKTARLGEAIEELRKISSAKSGKQIKKKKEIIAHLFDAKPQMSEIVLGVCQLFESFSSASGATIKVGLASIGPNGVEEFPFRYPHQWAVRSSYEKLRDPKSGISRSINGGKIVVVSNTQEECSKGDNARFIVTRDDLKDENCSLICFPVRDYRKQAIPFVLCISANKPGVFLEDSTDVYRDLLEPFGERLALEMLNFQVKQFN